MLEEYIQQEKPIQENPIILSKKNEHPQPQQNIRPVSQKGVKDASNGNGKLAKEEPQSYAQFSSGYQSLDQKSRAMFSLHQGPTVNAVFHK